jgi:hypothetical protein
MQLNIAVSKTLIKTAINSQHKTVKTSKNHITIISNNSEKYICNIAYYTDFKSLIFSIESNEILKTRSILNFVNCHNEAQLTITYGNESFHIGTILVANKCAVCLY